MLDLKDLIGPIGGPAHLPTRRTVPFCSLVTFYIAQSFEVAIGPLLDFMVEMPFQ